MTKTAIKAPFLLPADVALPLAEISNGLPPPPKLSGLELPVCCALLVKVVAEPSFAAVVTKAGKVLAVVEPLFELLELLESVDEEVGMKMDGLTEDDRGWGVETGCVLNDEVSVVEACCVLDDKVSVVVTVAANVDWVDVEVLSVHVVDSPVDRVATTEDAIAGL